MEQKIIHPDDIQDTRKAIAEAGQLFSTIEERVQALRNLTCEGAPIFGEGIINWLEEHGYFTAPASTRYHGAYAGGLFDHSWQVAVELQNMTDKLGLHWERPISPWIIGIFHDLCKIDTYSFNRQEKVFQWDDKGIIRGHGIKSLVYALQLCDLTPEEQACIVYHMGAFTPDKEWDSYTGAIHKYPNVLYIHTADMIADHVKGV